MSWLKKKSTVLKNRLFVRTKRQRTNRARTDCCHYCHFVEEHWDLKNEYEHKKQLRDSIQNCGLEAVCLFKPDVIRLPNAKCNWTPQFGSCSDRTPKTSMIPERLPWFATSHSKPFTEFMAAMITAGWMRVRLILSGPTAEDEKAESLLG